MHWIHSDLIVRAGRGGAGHELAAQGRIQRGARLMVWGGSIVGRAELEAVADDVRRCHSVQVDDGLFLLPSEDPHPADYVNHSCEPNAGFRGQITLVAMRDIAAGEAVSFDYAMSDSEDYDEFVCCCGALTCRGAVTGRDWRRTELQQRYVGFFSSYIEAKIQRLGRGEST